MSCENIAAAAAAPNEDAGGAAAQVVLDRLQDQIRTLREDLAVEAALSAQLPDVLTELELTRRALTDSQLKADALKADLLRIREWEARAGDFPVPTIEREDDGFGDGTEARRLRQRVSELELAVQQRERQLEESRRALLEVDAGRTTFTVPTCSEQDAALANSPSNREGKKGPDDDEAETQRLRERVSGLEFAVQERERQLEESRKALSEAEAARGGERPGREPCNECADKSAALAKLQQTSAETRDELERLCSREKQMGEVLRGEMTDLAAQNQNLANEMQRIAAEKDELVRQFEHRAEEKEREVSRLNEEASEMHAKVAELEVMLTDSHARATEAAMLAEEERDQQLRKRDEEVAELRRELAETYERAEGLRLAFRTAEATKQTHAGDVGAALQVAEDKSRMVAERDGEIRVLRERVAELSEALRAGEIIRRRDAEAVGSSSEALRDALDDLARRNEEIDRVRHEAEDARREVDRLESALRTAEDAKQATAGELAVALKVVEEREKTIDERNAAILALRDDLAATTETLRRHMADFEARSVPLDKAASRLREEAKEREGAICALRKQFEESQSACEALRVKGREGDAARRNDVTALEAALARKSTELEERSRRESALRDEVSVLQRTLDAARLALAEAERRARASVEEQLAASERRLSELRERHREERQNSSELLKRSREHLEMLTAEVDSLKKQLHDATDGARVEAEALQANLMALVEGSKKEADALREELARMTAEAAEAARRATADRDNEVGTAQRKLQEAGAALAAVEKAQCRQVDEMLATLTTQAVAYEDRIRKLAQRCTQSERRLATRERDYELLARAAERCRSIRDGVRAVLHGRKVVAVKQQCGGGEAPPDGKEEEEDRRWNDLVSAAEGLASSRGREAAAAQAARSRVRGVLARLLPRDDPSLSPDVVWSEADDADGDPVRCWERLVLALEAAAVLRAREKIAADACRGRIKTFEVVAEMARNENGSLLRKLFKINEDVKELRNEMDARSADAAVAASACVGAASYIAGRSGVAAPRGRSAPRSQAVSRSSASATPRHTTAIPATVSVTGQTMRTFRKNPGVEA